MAARAHPGPRSGRAERAEGVEPLRALLEQLFDGLGGEVRERTAERRLEVGRHDLRVAVRAAEGLGQHLVDEPRSRSSRSAVMPIASAASSFLSALFHRIEAQPSGEITE